MSTSNRFATIVLGLGAELLLLGIATGVASMSDEIGNLILIFMVGLLLLFVMTHTSLLQAIPGLFPAASTSTNTLGG